MWKLVPGTFPPVDNAGSPSYIYLSADYLETYEDEEDDLNKRYKKNIILYMPESFYHLRSIWYIVMFFCCCFFYCQVISFVSV